MNHNYNTYYISLVEFDYSRSATFLNNEASNKIIIAGHLFSKFKKIRKLVKLQNRNNTIFVVMSPSHQLTILLRIAGANKIVLDAGWPLSDSTSAKINIVNILRKISNYLIDFLSFKISKLILLESPEQVLYTSKKFLTSKKKLVFIYTGLQKNRFIDNPIRPVEVPADFEKGKYILFRGKSNKEAGIEAIIEHFEKTQAGSKLVVATNRKFNGETLKNTIVISRHLSNPEINWLYVNCQSTLGQFGASKRLRRTIPHKFFESVYFGVPYITPKQPPILRILGENYPFWISNIEELSASKYLIQYNYPQNVLKLTDSDSLKLFFDTTIASLYK
jgi:hypothetical protein